ncbi:MAG: hypothetical protein JWM80_4095 [Cyanobacteria bacterium RYN_339]|nr:hypothetical protein [Cyanobacteria bacterium RYN_339]
MQTANLPDPAEMLAEGLHSAPRQRPPARGSALVPARVSAMPIEPPHPREVEDKLEFRTAAQYKKAVMLAERYVWQARLAVDRRKASVKKNERQAQVDHEETAGNYARQVFHAQARYKSYMEQCHAKHRQAIYQARVGAGQAEDVYKRALESVPGYGRLQLALMALNDSRAVTQSLVAAYKTALGPDGMGDLHLFLTSLDKVADFARDRRAVVPMQFAESLLKAVVQRQVRHMGADKHADKAELEKLKQAAGARLLMIQGFLAEGHPDATPAPVRTAYFAVHEWLGKATGTPFELALDRLKRDIDGVTRREEQNLSKQIEIAVQQSNQLSMLRPVAEAYDRAQRMLLSSEQAAKNVLHQEIARIEQQLEKELQLADAMVVGMDHTAARRLAESKRALMGARKMVGRWSRVLNELEEVGRWQKLVWRVTENFDHESFWLDTRAKLSNRA